VIAFFGEADFDTAPLISNSFEIEWPPESGRIAAFPEVDRAAWLPWIPPDPKSCVARPICSIDSKNAPHDAILR
jgi:predicted NUDIX family NTP pyrophosphohydrolase